MTNYQGMFHYENNILNFFATAEGYVNVSGGGNGIGYKISFNYVYNYTDHLGNIRLSYTNNSVNGITILEENHYYPFGLKHKKYGSVDKDFIEIEGQGGYYVGIDIVSPQARKAYQYKFQSQERQDELGLNWDSFKWRNYDFAIGRFMSIDPLTEEYHTWSPYVFSGNCVIDARELEGLEPHSVHKELQGAVANFAEQYNGYSMKSKVEIATQLYKTQNGEYSYTNPKQFTASMANIDDTNPPPSDAVFVGIAHTHGANDVLSLLYNDTTNRSTNAKGMSPNEIVKRLQNGEHFHTGPNKPSQVDIDSTRDIDVKSSTFERSYVITPSGLAYSIGFGKNGKIESNIN